MRMLWYFSLTSQFPVSCLEHTYLAIILNMFHFVKTVNRDKGWYFHKRLGWLGCTVNENQPAVMCSDYIQHITMLISGTTSLCLYCFVGNITHHIFTLLFSAVLLIKTNTIHLRNHSTCVSTCARVLHVHVLIRVYVLHTLDNVTLKKTIDCVLSRQWWAQLCWLNRWITSYLAVPAACNLAWR